MSFHLRHNVRLEKDSQTGHRKQEDRVRSEERFRGEKNQKIEIRDFLMVYAAFYHPPCIHIKNDLKY